ncbi:potassium voltage-gated channel subfamily E member 3 isoform X2 [Tyto alba]|uniref:potassium voltage-gated channel subfamily E member 3 isoform X2 n=1 Tax=Tyto alba TaxID=56313 RepID=UPI001C66784E|nr:potassium voltage-gated channel subfamily E member 3 isoform X2 [Tyto alba]
MKAPRAGSVPGATAGTDGGGTGKRDRQRVLGGKRRVRLSQPHKTSSIRPGQGNCGGTRGAGDRLVARVGAGWLWQVALPREGEEAARHSQPGRYPLPPPCDAPVPAQPWQQRRQGGHPSLEEDMEEDNQTETWHRSLQAVLNALNQTLHGVVLCPADRPATTTVTAAARNASARAGRPGRNDNAYMYILFVMTLFAATVGSLILGYTRSRKVDKRSDPYHVYIKNRVSMI